MPQGAEAYAKGGALLSEKHCNFLINEGQATAEDLEQLGEESGIGSNSIAALNYAGNTRALANTPQMQMKESTMSYDRRVAMIMGGWGSEGCCQPRYSQFL